jgi:hypothetical protein
MTTQICFVPGSVRIGCLKRYASNPSAHRLWQVSAVAILRMPAGG